VLDEGVPEVGREAGVEGAATAGVDVDAIADGGRGVGLFEDGDVAAGGAEAVGEGEAAEAGAGDEDAEGHAASDLVQLDS
jgi:hypothetical protein